MKNNKLKEFFAKMFKDENDINEKSIVGFASFLMMCLTLFVDLITGYLGREMPIQQFVFDGFLWITLGSFGIASIDKYITTNKKQNGTDEPVE